MDIENIAKICHEINRVYCVSLGDLSQPIWEHAPTWQKESAIAGVKFHLDNPSAGPDHSHQSWLNQKEKDGWCYGAVKNDFKKEHPCFVPYNKLPKSQKFKDTLFSTIVKAA